MVISRTDNDLLTQTHRGTPMGDLMRRYWMPALLASELPEPDCPPVRVRLLGEDLVAFRDTAGRIGLLEEFCPHRRASLFLGRNEEHGIRCVFHGWKFDVAGRCLDMMNEPADSDFKDKISIASYPVVEVGDVVWAYMGPSDRRPPEPMFEWAQGKGYPPLDVEEPPGVQLAPRTGRRSGHGSRSHSSPHHHQEHNSSGYRSGHKLCDRRSANVGG